MDEFEVSIARREGCVLVSVRGDVDRDTAPWLERELARLGPRERVVVDLSQVRFLSSAGIVVLLRGRGFGRPSLCCQDASSVARMLEFVEAERFVRVYRDLAAALRGSRAA
jgi:anti-anti-sigma factor